VNACISSAPKLQCIPILCSNQIAQPIQSLHKVQRFAKVAHGKKSSSILAPVRIIEQRVQGGAASPLDAAVALEEEAGRVRPHYICVHHLQPSACPLQFRRAILRILQIKPVEQEACSFTLMLSVFDEPFEQEKI